MHLLRNTLINCTNQQGTLSLYGAITTVYDSMKRSPLFGLAVSTDIVIEAAVAIREVKDVTLQA